MNQIQLRTQNLSMGFAVKRFGKLSKPILRKKSLSLAGKNI